MDATVYCVLVVTNLVCCRGIGESGASVCILPDVLCCAVDCSRRCVSAGAEGVQHHSVSGSEGPAEQLGVQ